MLKFRFACVLGLLLAFVAHPAKAQGTDLSCPAGFQVVQGPYTTTLNPTTGARRINFCLDPATGHLFYQGDATAGAATNSIYAFATTYGVKADAHYTVGATFTSGSGNVTIPATATPFSSSDIGKICFGTTYTGGTGLYSADTLRMNQGTISTVTDATHATCSATSSSNGTGTFVWGSDDTAALIAAFAAAFNNTNKSCLTLVLPAGNMLVQQGLGNIINCVTSIPATNDFSAQVLGQGHRVTALIPTPNFSYNHSTSCNGSGIAGYSSCFFGVNGISVRDLMIFGAGYCNISTGGTGATAAVYLGQDSYFQNVDLERWGCSDTTDPFIGYIVSSGGNNSYNINNNGTGEIGYFMNSGFSTTADSFFCCNALNAIFVQGGDFTDRRSGFGYVAATKPVINNAGGTIRLIGSESVANTANSNPYSQTSGIGRFENAYIQSTSTGAAFSVSGGTVHSHQTTYLGTTQISMSGSAVFIDECGNSITVAPSGGTFAGDCSATGTADVAGNHVLTSGWGTANVNTVTGFTKQVKFTISITGGVPAAGPVLTDTFATTFQVTPGGGCTLTQIGGTFGVLTNPVPSSLSATGVTWTFTGTPVNGQSYTFVRLCGN